jgi:hypothetical protein
MCVLLYSEWIKFESALNPAVALGFLCHSSFSPDDNGNVQEAVHTTMINTCTHKIGFLHTGTKESDVVVTVYIELYLGGCSCQIIARNFSVLTGFSGFPQSLHANAGIVSQAVTPAYKLHYNLLFTSFLIIYV